MLKYYKGTRIRYINTRYADAVLANAYNRFKEI